MFYLLEGNYTEILENIIIHMQISAELEKPSYKCEFDGTNHEYLERVGWSSRCVIMRVPPSLTFVGLQIPRCCFGGFIVITSDQN